MEYFIIANPLLTYSIIFFGMFFEGEGIIILASIFAWQGHLNWGTLAGAILAGTYLGDLVWYAAGRMLRGTRFGNWLDRKYEKPGDTIKKAVTEHYGRFAILSKFLYFTTHPTVFIVGWHQFKFRSFLWVTLYSTLIWSAVVLGIGYFFGYAIELIGYKRVVHRIEIFAILLFTAVFIFSRLLKNQFRKKTLQ
ncbi:MAG: VTT domain-containing protein [bacterium]|nr:VTT domain-containing protein [bacterium]